HPPNTYPLPLHDALPIFGARDVAHDRDLVERRIARIVVAERQPVSDPRRPQDEAIVDACGVTIRRPHGRRLLLSEFIIRAKAGADRKSTRLNSSHEWISY